MEVAHQGSRFKPGAPVPESSSEASFKGSHKGSDKGCVGV